ncbi:MAG: tandem-95 repeat protein [Sphingobacteriaceae bacterium]|jgi:gliding motility-associated-like protein|nr:tandem-95 repeat protein [Sphingobacteriaceae bacterium]
MIKSTRYLLLLLLIGFQQAKAQFTYFESFTHTTAPGVIFGGSPTAFLTAGSAQVGDTDGNGYLRLTNNNRNQTGFVYSNVLIPSTSGLKIEFEYFTYGGSRADGIAFFLFDASTANFNIGGFGGSLGYAQINLTNPVTPGVSNGYLGVGIDEYGNFSNPIEGRQGGTGFFPQSVTLRGKGNGAALTPDNYKFLTSKEVLPLGFNMTGGTVRHPLQSDPEYRKAFIDMKPNPLGGYNISVRIMTGGATPVTYTVIDNYYYPEAAPSVLKYGISSSTGDQNNFHEIRNLRINPFVNTPPVAVNDAASTLKNTSKLIDVIANDTDIDGNSTIQRTSLVIKSNPLHGTLTINPATGNVLYTPTTGYVGPDSFTYSIKDAEGAESNTATVSIQVVNTIEPQAANDNATTVAGTAVNIDITANDTGGDGTLVLSTVVISPPLHGTTTYDPTTGKVVYTPATGFHGRDVFTYTIKNSNGLISNTATVSVDVRPVGTNDNSLTKVNTAAIIPVKDNDASKTGSSVVKKTNPLHGVVVVNPDGTVTYTPTTGYFGPDSFTYTLLNADGLESDPITVNIVVNTPPVAVNDNASTAVGASVTVDVTANDTDADGTVNKASVTIVSQPLNGILSVDPITGRVTYTPVAGFSAGTDNFTYTVKDDRGQVSNIATVTITVNKPSKIGLAKAVESSTIGINGTYDIKYVFTVANLAQDLLQNVSITDDLNKAFAGSNILVKSIRALGILKVNSAYNGMSVTELLLPGNSIAAGTTEQIEIVINVTLTTSDGLFLNTAFAEGTNSIGVKVTDQSTNGLKADPLTPGDNTPLEPTPVTLKFQPLFIPGGFSPNNDNTNDTFLIWNTYGKNVSIEIFNRWGSRVYKSADYQNDWAGKCTEGIRLGDDVPEGTYYYIIIIDHKDKYVGHITLNR